MSNQWDGTVVVGVAESVFAGRALPWAAEQAQLAGRALTLVNASGPVSGAWNAYGMDAVPTNSADLRERGERLLARARAVIERTAPALDVNEVFEVTDPSTLLIETSSSAYLVVLGSRGRGPVRSHLLGSVGLAVVRHAGCPIVVHRPEVHPGLERRGVVVAADATEEAVPVLAFAFREASLRGLPLEVVHYVYDVRSVLVGTPMVGSLSEETEQHERALGECLDGFREMYPHVPLTVTMLPGLLPEDGLVRLGRDAHLTVVGTHQRGALSRMLAGSVSEAVLEHACGPVAVVPIAVWGHHDPGPRADPKRRYERQHHRGFRVRLVAPRAGCAAGAQQPARPLAARRRRLPDLGVDDQPAARPRGRHSRAGRPVDGPRWCPGPASGSARSTAGPGPTSLPAYMFVQYVLGPEYAAYSWVVLLHVAMVALSGGLTLMAWWRAQALRAPSTSARQRRRISLALMGLAAFVLLRYLPAFVGALTHEPIAAEFRDARTFFWSIVLLDLGVVVPMTVASAVALLRAAPAGTSSMYGVVGWFALVPPSVTSMAAVMVVRDDPHASVPTMLLLAVATLAFWTVAGGVLGRLVRGGPT